MKQNTGTKMTNPPIWDAAYELLEPSGENKPESGGKEICLQGNN